MDYKSEAEKRLQERARIFEERKSVNEDSNLSDAEKRERFDRMDADMDRLASEARGLVEEGEREAEIRNLTARAGALSVPTPGQDKSDDEARAFEDALKAVGLGDRRAFDWTASAAVMEGRAVTSVGTTNGGTGSAQPLTQETFVATLLQSMEETSDVLSRVRRLSTSGGELMEWPRRVSKAGNTFQFISENGTYQAASDGSYERFPLNAYKFGAIAEITEEALSDPALNVGALVAQDMGEDLADSLAAVVFSGSGTNEPHGLLPASIHDTALAGHAITFDELIDLQHAIISKYRRNAVWYLNDLVARDVRKLKATGSGDYIWQPAVIAGQPDMLLGKPVHTEVNMGSDLTALSSKVVLFGDVNRAYVLRTVRAIGIVRSNEYGFDRDTVALKIKWRGDGDVSDPNAYATLTTPAA